MAKQTVGIGATANDGNGDGARVAFDKINDNFDEIYTAFGDGSALGSYQEVLAEGAFADGDKTKLDTIETSADVTDETNVLSALNGATITAATIARTDKLLFQDVNDTDNLKVETLDDAIEAANVSSAGAPASAPDFVNQIFYDTLNDDVYIAGGTSSSADWTKVSAGAGTISFTGSNSTGSQIDAGTPVYFSGGSGAISPCDSDTPSSFPCCGIAAEDIANSGSGNVVVVGEIGSLDTSAFSINDVLYPGSGGGLTATEPTSGTVQPVAIVKASDAGSGIILVDRKISGSATITQSIWAPANSMTPATTSGAEAVTRELATNDVDVDVLRFDSSADEYAVFSVAMPKGWDEGTVTFQAFWTHTGASTNFGVTWGLQAIAFGNDDALDASWGTAVVVDDTGGTNDDVYVSAESSAVTIGGTPAEGDMVIFRVFRDYDDTNDDMATDADLLGVKIFYTVNSLSEA